MHRNKPRLGSIYLFQQKVANGLLLADGCHGAAHRCMDGISLPIESEWRNWSAYPVSSALML